MDIIGTLKIRKNNLNYIVKFSALYFYINSKQYNLLKYIYKNRFNQNLINKYKSDEIYAFLNNTGNLVRNNIYYSKDCICIDYKSSKKINKINLMFFISFFNTKDILICSDNKVIKKAEKTNIFEKINNIKLNKLYLIRYDSELGETVRSNKHDLKRYCSI